MSTAPPPTSRWRREPFRVFFPLAILLGWVGVGHWLLYATGMTATYSCYAHGLVQMQAFMPALAMGFLLTALPRRTQSAAPSAAEMTGAVALLVLGGTAAFAEHTTVAEGAYLGLLLLLGRFAGRRLGGRDAARRPPAAFVLIPLGLMNGAFGAVLLMAGGSAIALGRLLVEQGVFSCLVVGVGALILPLILGTPPPRDLDRSPRERARLLLYAAVGLAIDAGFVAEAAGLVRGGPLLRALALALGLALAGAWRMPTQADLHRWLAWAGVWLAPIGLAASALLPDYRVPALHVLFIGGFATLGLAVATHVSFGHLGLTGTRRRPVVVALTLGLGLALLARVAADWSDTYFVHLGWAAAAWIVGTGVWLGVLGPRLLGR